MVVHFAWPPFKRRKRKARKTWSFCTPPTIAHCYILQEFCLVRWKKTSVKNTMAVYFAWKSFKGERWRPRNQQVFAHHQPLHIATFASISSGHKKAWGKKKRCDRVIWIANVWKEKVEGGINMKFLHTINHCTLVHIGRISSGHMKMSAWKRTLWGCVFVRPPFKRRKGTARKTWSFVTIDILHEFHLVWL